MLLKLNAGNEDVAWQRSANGLVQVEGSYLIRYLQGVQERFKF